jgi:microcystin-dependent protein
MKSIIGNYTGQPSKDFPLDAEGLAALAGNTAMMAILGNICGERAILRGCEPLGGGAQRNPGYLFLRTSDYPDGEVIYFEGGPTTGGMYLKKETEAISAYGVDYPQAYTARSLAPGIGTEQYTWEGLEPVATNAALSAQIAAHTSQIALLAPPPLGVVQMWAGAINQIPASYRLCDGSSLQVADHPDLYAAMGAIHGGVPGVSFKLPDLRGRFIVGYHPNDADYDQMAKNGGEKRHTLTPAELPAHTHAAETGKFVTTTAGTTNGGGGDSSRACLTNGRVDLASNTGLNIGGGQSHENRPPYYTLAYIMRVQ